jgi:hypothetical protein
LNGADHRFILKHGLNLEQCKLRYREYFVERLPVLISGNDKPETTDEEYYYDSEVSEERSFEQYYANCSCTLQNPCEKCKEIKEKILKSSSEESEGEDNDNGGTPNLSSKESESDYDTDWDDPHNGQHPNCTDCEDIRADECQDAECTEHGTGDTEGYEDPPEEPPEAYESLPNKDDNDETPIDSEEAEEIINVIEQLQKESEMANSLAKDAIKNLKATNYTTQAIKNHLEKEMIKQEETFRNLSSDFDKLSEENATVRNQVEKVTEALTKITSEVHKRPANTLQRKAASTNIIDPFTTDGNDNGMKLKWRTSTPETKWIHHHSAPRRVIRNFLDMEEIEKKIDCSCDRIDKENSRNKINNAIEGLKNAIQTQSKKPRKGKVIHQGDKTYVNCHKAHGRKLFVIIKYATTLPGIGDEVLEIWRKVRESSNVITRRDLITVSIILNRYAEKVEDGLLVENDRAMFGAGLDFMSVRDEIVDDFSTDEESIETINHTSKAYGEATGARPKTGNQTNSAGHYTGERDDRKFKDELKRRNERDAEIKRDKAAIERTSRNLSKWNAQNMRENTGFFNEIGNVMKSKIELFNANALKIAMKKEMDQAKARETAHEAERKKARSARREAKHCRPRNRDKIKIPAPPGEDYKSSETYYTSTTEESGPENERSET